ncbi:PREDICTED: uncharacterized protein LOC109160952 [Ipomoea nil]|uniref:uncharacterized protein LOC109160952 n=1 Tax=Ipomoea nil TaxID=35883 RepID=UPI000901B374|nr:PREDICTED: uncharacterized protein LOC109160952 [Ipomoea nil]
MDDEELEPLFDYHRVQPYNAIILDDDSPDSSPVANAKKRKIDTSVDEEKQDNKDVIQVIDCEEKEEEDWLKLPPKISADTVKKRENSTIKEIRLKKQELASLAESAKHVLRDVEDSVKRDLSTSLQSSEGSVAEQQTKPCSERAKIIICIQDKDGSKQFRVFMDDKFERLFKLYADKAKLNLQNLIFRFDGDKISPTATPHSLGMEDDDIVEVHVKPS